MATFKCKMCGGDLEIAEGVTIAECEYCGTKQTVPKAMDENMQNLFNRANTLRIKSEFDKAEKIYEKIIQADSTQSEAYWGLILCKYGIEYVDDPKTFKKIPTCHRASYDSIIADDDYKSAIENADMAQRLIYEEQAREIDRIQKEILALAQREENYDVFICYKETDANGRRTQDSVIANDIYYQLKQEGFKVFYAAITLEGKLGSAYEPIIFAALNSAKVMLVIGTKPEYFTAVWVKNEWSRFLSLIKQGQKKTLIPAYRDMDPYNLPEEFSHLQAQDMSKLGFMPDLVRGIKKIADFSEPKPAVVKEPVGTSGNTNAAPLLKRAFMFLEDKDWENADAYCEKVLDVDPENTQAYLCKLMSKLQVNDANKVYKWFPQLNEKSSYREIREIANYTQRVSSKDEMNSKTKYVVISKEIKEKAFYGCENVEKFIISDNVRSIGDEAFAYCDSLENITIPNSVKTIGNHAFEGNQFKTLNIPDSVESVGDAFVIECSELTKITIGKALKKIEGALDYTDLENIEVHPANTTFKSIDGNLYSKDGKTLIKYATGKKETSFIIPSHVRHISCNAFQDCQSLVNVEIPESVTSIGEYAFDSCAIKSIVIPSGVTNISENSFSGCASLKSVIISEGVTSIGEYAFFCCTSLDSVVIADSVTSIGENAFAGCNKLKTVTLGSGIKDIPQNAFPKLPSLQFIDSVEKKKLMEKYKIELYEEATAAYQTKTLESLNKAKTLFGELGDWQDSSDLYKKCCEEINVEKEYINAVCKFDSKSKSEFLNALETFKKIRFWKDSDDYILKSPYRINELEALESMERAEQERKRIEAERKRIEAEREAAKKARKEKRKKVMRKIRTAIVICLIIAACVCGVMYYNQYAQYSADFSINNYTYTSPAGYTVNIPFNSVPLDVAPGSTVIINYSLPDGTALECSTDTDGVSIKNGNEITFGQRLKEGSNVKVIIRVNKIVVKTIDFVIKSEGLNGNFGGGYGSANRPYIISEAQHLYNVSIYPDSRFIQTTDIVLRVNTETDANWSPIELFSGYYDGNGFAIKNLRIYSYVKETDGYFYGAGFVAVNKGTIKNLTISDAVVSITTNEDGSNATAIQVGGVAGRNKGVIEHCTVENSTLYGRLNDKDNNLNLYGYCAGIAGRQDTDGKVLYSTVKNCDIDIYLPCQLKSSDTNFGQAGGIVGKCAGTMEYCLSIFNDIYADIRGDGTSPYFNPTPDAYAGGLVGRLDSGAVISNCIGYSNVVDLFVSTTNYSEGTEFKGQLVGRCNGIVNTNVYCNDTVNPLCGVVESDGAFNAKAANNIVQYISSNPNWYIDSDNIPHVKIPE